MKLKTVASIIAFSLISTTMSQANLSEVDTFTPCGLDETQSYYAMSTEDIQMEVEKHSAEGDLPFELGLELIKRWTNS